MKKITILIMFIFVCSFMLCTDINSAYIYSQYNTAISSAEAMTVKSIIDSKSIINEKGKYESFTYIEDIYVSDEEDDSLDRIYILDQKTSIGYVIRNNKAVPVESNEVLSGETYFEVSLGKIVAVDNEYKYVARYPNLQELTLEQFELYKQTFQTKYLNLPTALFVSDNYVYVSDTENGRIFTLNKDLSRLESENVSLFQNPDDITFTSTAFKPTKFVYAENTGRVYSVASGVYEGIVDFKAASHKELEDGYAQGKITYQRFINYDLNTITPSYNDINFDLSNKNAFIYQDNSWIEFADYSNLLNEAWMMAEGSPKSTIGENNDIYIDSVTLSIYYKLDGTWNYFGKVNDKTQLQEQTKVSKTYFGTSDNIDSSELGDSSYFIDNDKNVFYKYNNNWNQIENLNLQTLTESFIDNYGIVWAVQNGTPKYEKNDTRVYYVDNETLDFYYNNGSKWVYQFNISTKNFLENSKSVTIGEVTYNENTNSKIEFKDNLIYISKNNFNIAIIDPTNKTLTYDYYQDNLNHKWFIGLDSTLVTPTYNDFFLDVANKVLYEYGASGWQEMFNYKTTESLSKLSYLPSNKIYLGTQIPNNDLGENDDMFFNQHEGIIYKKVNNEYIEYVKFKDLNGNYYESKDLDNHTWFVGTNIPEHSNGTINDYYIDYISGNIYKKGEEVWEHYVNFSELAAQKGTFSRYYGTNSVATSSIWDLFKSAFQRQVTGIKLQLTFTNLTIDEKGYIYTVSPSGSGLMIKKLNFLGSDVLKPSVTRPNGELVTQWYDTDAFAMGSSILMDIALKDESMYSVVDTNYDRIYTYDFEGNLLYIFGQNGNTSGNLKQPTAISYYNNEVLVSDREKNQVIVFEPTEFGLTVNNATRKYYDGDYDGAREDWEKVLKYNTNYYLAYSGIGKSLYRNGDYESAMNYFKKGYNRTNYSNAYKEYRQTKLEQIMPYVLLGFALLVVYGFYRSFKAQFIKNKDEGDIV